MLWDVFRVLGDNSFKRNFYEAKKIYIYFDRFSIFYKNDI